EEIEHALAPGEHGIVALEQLERTDASGPLERAEHGVVGIERLVSADEGLRIQEISERQQTLAERRKSILAAGLNRFERRTEAFFARRAEIGFVLLVHVLPDVQDHASYEAQVKHRIRPALNEPRHRAAGAVAE